MPLAAILRPLMTRPNRVDRSRGGHPIGSMPGSVTLAPNSDFPLLRSSDKLATGGTQRSPSAEPRAGDGRLPPFGCGEITRSGQVRRGASVDARRERNRLLILRYWLGKPIAVP